MAKRFGCNGWWCCYCNYPAADTKKVTDAIAAYNAKVAAATAAATAYTTAYNNIFDTDSVAKLNELYYKEYWANFET